MLFVQGFPQHLIYERMEKIMADAAVAFSNFENQEGTGFEEMSEFEVNGVNLETDISSEHCFEDIVGGSPAIQRVLEQVAIVAPTFCSARSSRASSVAARCGARLIRTRSSRSERLAPRARRLAKKRSRS